MLPWLFASLRGYRIGWLPRDLVAGLMLAAIAIPGQLATARLAGMPPETGLYAFADRKSTRLNSSHPSSPYAVLCFKKKYKTLNWPLLLAVLQRTVELQPDHS